MSTDRALNEAEAAQLLGISAATLRNWRHQGKGPVFHRFGRTVRYMPADIEVYVAENAADREQRAAREKR